jgi:hypothetical protein
MKKKDDMVTAVLEVQLPELRAGCGYTSRALVGVLLGSLSIAEASCPLCMDTFCCNSGSSRVRVRSDPIEWRQPIVEPSLISWTVKREFGRV